MSFYSPKQNQILKVFCPRGLFPKAGGLLCVFVLSIFQDVSPGYFFAPPRLNRTDATKITLAPSNADMNQGENVTLQCHASHDPTMDLTFTWALNGVLLDLEDPAGPYHRVEGVRETASISRVRAVAVDR